MKPRHFLGALVATMVPGVTTGDELANLIREEARLSCVNVSTLSQKIFGHASRVSGLHRTVGPVTKKTVEPVIAWLKRLPWSAEFNGLDALVEAASTMEEREGPRPARGGIPAPVSDETLALIGEVDAYQAESGMGDFEFARRALGWRSLNGLRNAKVSSRATADKIRDFIASKPEVRRMVTPTSVAREQRRGDLEEVAGRMNRKRATGERAHLERRPGETLADCIRRLEAEPERAAEAAPIAIEDPSSLIRRAQQDWPEQAAKVAAIAARIGVRSGEAWRQVIAAGVEALSEGGS